MTLYQVKSLIDPVSTWSKKSAFLSIATSTSVSQTISFSQLSCTSFQFTVMGLELSTSVKIAGISKLIVALDSVTSLVSE
jgi:hypothetical protein